MTNHADVTPDPVMSSGDDCVPMLLETGADAVYAIFASDRRPLTHGQLRREVARTGATLAAHGIRRADVVAVVLPNGPEMAVCFLGVTAAAACAPLNPAYRESEFAFFLEDLKPALLIVHAGVNSAARSAAAKLGIPLAELFPDSEAPAGTFHLTFGERRAAGRPAPDRCTARDTALVLHTSGTTSRPKMVPLSHENLWASARNIASTLALSPDDCGLIVMPLFHIHGLMAGLLAPLAAGGSVACMPGFVATQFFDWLDRFRPTWYTAVPTIHQAVLARAAHHPDALARCRLRFLRSSSASLPPSVMADLEQAFRAPVVEAYGMTEASHQMASNPLPPGARKAGSVGRPAGAAIAIVDAQGRIFEPGAGASGVAEVVVRGASIMAGYVGQSESTPAFTDGWFRTGDLGQFDADGYLFLRGRTKEIINRAGEKISPREVDEALLEHPAVAAAVTFAMSDPKLGEEVAAAVVLRPGAAASEPDLMAFAARRLADFKIPRRIVFLDDLPKGATGKVQRIGLAAKLGIDTIAVSTPSARVEPRTDTERRLAAIWRDVLRVDHIGAFDGFLSAGGDSVLAAQVAVHIEADWGVTVPAFRLFGHATLESVARAIETAPPSHGSAAVALEKVSRNAPLALSPGQQRIWFLAKYEGADAAYQSAVVFRLRGPIDREWLATAIQTVVDRHEVLRTVYGFDATTPVQTVLERAAISLAVEERAECPADCRDAEAGAAVAAIVRQPIDLARDLPIRVRLLRFADDDHALVVVVHHIAFDGWSAAIFSREVSAVYGALSSGAPIALSELTVQYADYAAWRRQTLATDRSAADLDYWLNRLSGAPRLLALPTDFLPRPRVRAFAGAVVRCEFPRRLVDDLRTLARAETATLYMALLAAFQWQLGARAGQSDVVVGTPVAARALPEFERLIGSFINTLVMRADLNAAGTFRELLRQVRDSVVGAIEHQGAPIERLVAALRPPRTLGHAPVFQVLFQLRNIPDAVLTLPDVESRRVSIDPGTAQFDLSLDVTETEPGLACALTYDTALFSSATAEGLLDDYRRTLDAFVAAPDGPLRIAPVPAPLPSTAVTTIAAPHGTLAEIVEAQVARTPQATAVIVGEERLTYAALNDRANRLAHHLRRLGVTPDALVGAFLERSANLIVTLLGILKAGGAYVPLDPAYPSERIGKILEDSGAALVVTERALARALPPFGGRTLRVDADWPAIAAQQADNPTPLATPSNLAYVMFTSGSTGRPKGVAIEHRAASAFVAWGHATFSREELAGVLFSTSVCFDLSVFELFVTLGAGGALIVAPTALHLPALPARNAVTLINTVPSVMAEVLRGGGVPDSVHTVNLCGEVLLDGLVSSIYASTRARRVYNLYGPTETTVYATFTAVGRGERVTIGRPIDGTRVYVLDEEGREVPAGEQGELFIAGAGVARGYYGRPDLTNERFSPDPFVPGERMYRTGDFGRRLPDGTLEFIGRVDQQVKVRGLRIELGEIESILARHAAVGQCVLAARNDGGGLRLVAYVEPAASMTPDVRDLRAHVARSLPDYMVPAAFVALDRLPRMPTGKADRRALPAPPELVRQALSADAPPASAEEAVLMAIWQDVLECSPIGRHDDFFQIGGDSLAAARVFALIESRLHVALPLSALFDGPTIAQLADAVRARQQTSKPDWPALHVLTEATGPRFFCVHTISGDVLGFRGLAETLGADRAFVGVQAILDDRVREIYESVETTARAYLAEIRVMQPEGPYFLGGMSSGASVAFEIAQQLRVAGQEVALLAVFDAAPRNVGADMRRFALRNLGRLIMNVPRWIRDDLMRSDRGDVMWRTRRKLEMAFERGADLALRRGEGRERGIRDVVNFPRRSERWETFLELHDHALRRYVPRPYDGRVTVFKARTHPLLWVNDTDLAWRRLTADVAVRHVPGTHLSMLHPPHVAALGAELRSAIDEASARVGHSDIKPSRRS